MAEWLEYLESPDLAVGSGSCALASVASVASRALARARCLGLVLAVPISHWRGKSPRPKGGASRHEVGRASRRSPIRRWGKPPRGPTQFEGGASRHEGQLKSKVGQAATRARSSIRLPVLQGSKALRDVLQALPAVVLQVLPGLVRLQGFYPCFQIFAPSFQRFLLWYPCL